LYIVVYILDTNSAYFDLHCDAI